MLPTGPPLSASSNAAEFWPYRNQMLVTLAATAFAATPLTEILVGTVVGDDAHPDGTVDFVNALDRLVCLQAGVCVVAPAFVVSTLDLTRKAAVPRSVLGWTFSCHTGEWACGSCRGFNKHRHVIECLAADDGVVSERA